MAKTKIDKRIVGYRVESPDDKSAQKGKGEAKDRKSVV